MGTTHLSLVDELLESGELGRPFLNGESFNNVASVSDQAFNLHSRGRLSNTKRSWTLHFVKSRKQAKGILSLLIIIQRAVKARSKTNNCRL